MVLRLQDEERSSPQILWCLRILKLLKLMELIPHLEQFPVDSTVPQGSIHEECHTTIRKPVMEKVANAIQLGLLSRCQGSGSYVFMCRYVDETSVVQFIADWFTKHQ